MNAILCFKCSKVTVNSEPGPICQTCHTRRFAVRGTVDSLGFKLDIDLLHAKMRHGIELTHAETILLMDTANENASRYSPQE